MICEGCGERMQAETVITVRRVHGLRRSRACAGWFCWTCRASVAALDEARPKVAGPGAFGVFAAARLARLATTRAAPGC